MENPNNLKKPLLSQSLCRPKVVVKRKRYRRSRSAPIIESTPVALNGGDNTSHSEMIYEGLHPSLKKVAAFLSIYLGVGIICFYMIGNQISGKKTNEIVDAFYFCVVTMTTVGYGDLFPETTFAKLFACAYVFLGMALVGLVISEAADYLVEKQEKILVKALHSQKTISASDFMREVETSNVGYKCLLVSIVLFVLVISGTIFLALVEKLDFVNSFYCVCTTITSLGYGDRSFSTKRGRVFATLWILVSTICFAQFFLYVAELYTERRQNDLIQWVLTRHVTTTDLEAADMNHDGEVDAAEFILHQLKEMGKITREDIALVMKEFEELDVDQSGTLSLSDITLAQSSPHGEK